VTDTRCPVATAPAGHGRKVFSTRDPAEAHAYVCRTYSDTDMTLIGDQSRFRLREEQADLGSFALITFSHTTGLELVAEPLGRLMVAYVTSGEWQSETIGEERTCGPGEVCIVAQPDRPFLTRWSAPVRLRFVALDPSTLLDVAAAPGGLVPRFTSLVPSSAQGGRLVSTVLDHIVHDVAGNPRARQNPVIRGRAARTLAAALLEALPNNAVRDPAGADRSDATRSRVLRTAVAYLHDYAHTDISVRQLAEAAGASRQAVHLAFRQHLETTPYAYLERVRLDRVHRDLTDLDPAVTTVRDVGLLWGFPRLERLRRQYRAAFGVDPEQTLAGADPARVRLV
jgi:AraC-like DNA-binding protein